jgi:hypothetical protein
LSLRATIIVTGMDDALLSYKQELAVKVRDRLSALWDEIEDDYNANCGVSMVWQNDNDE